MCRSGRWETRDSWEIERRRSERPPADLRASDTDREHAISQLSRHTGEGRLTLEEFESRVDEAWRATTHRELQHVMRELPVAPTPKPRGYAREQIRRAAFWLLVMVAAVVVIGAGALWWLIPLAWFKFGAIGHHRHARRFEPRQLATRSDDLTRV